MATFRAYLPDGEEYIGLGLKPDIEVSPTKAAIHQGVDIVLDMGLEVLGDWDSYVK